jgi:hypothetical protein
MNECRLFLRALRSGGWVACLLPALLACKSGSSAREASATPVAPPAAEAAVAEAPAGDAVAAPVDVSAPPAEVAAAAVDAAAPSEVLADVSAEDAVRGTVTVRFQNEVGKPRFVTYARWWTEEFKLERSDGTNWTVVAWDSPVFAEPCPADGSEPTCRPFLPPTPQPTYLRVRDLLDFAWSGVEYEYVTAGDGSCTCYREGVAPAGRYRATLCTHVEIGCDSPPCPTEGPGEMLGYGQGEPSCASVEFELSAADVTVDLEVGAAS